METSFKLFMVLSAIWGIVNKILSVLLWPFIIILGFMTFYSFIAYFSKDKKRKHDATKSHYKWEDIGEKFISFFEERPPWKLIFVILIIFIIWYINQ